MTTDVRTHTIFSPRKYYHRLVLGRVELVRKTSASFVVCIDFLQVRGRSYEV